ncbi:MAG: S-layer homology domain-containing protein [Clostridiales Family XIII bacterium]|jgi:hypothetical protein|nr:S-layer homology domain-containing protein [Clostridiales Family XIII bacterium]
MKSELGRFGKKLISCLLVPVMLFGTIPGGVFAASAAGVERTPEAFADARELLDALRETAAAPGQSNAEQSDQAYLFGGKSHKVIYNDSIACYVSLEDGSFTILPAAAKFDPEKPASRATFSIDGERYAFGEIRGEIDAGDGTIFIPPVVENDMVAAHYAVGDYVISQYLAITKEAAHENAYAVKVGYGAEYFGTAPSEISGEILIDTPDDAAFLTPDGVPLAQGTELRPVPDALYAPGAAGAKPFLVLREEKGTAPGAAVCADGAVKLLFDAAKAGGDPDAAQNDIALFNANYGFYDLSPARLELTPAAEPLASRSMPRMGALMAAGDGTASEHPFYVDAAAPNAITLLTDVKWIENNVRCVKVGDEIAFRADLVNDGRMRSWLKAGYGKRKADSDPPEIEEAELQLTPNPDAEGTYTFTVPGDICVNTENPGDNGSISVSVSEGPAEGALIIPGAGYPNGDENKVGVKISVTSPGGIELSHNKYALPGDTVTVRLERLVAGIVPAMEIEYIKNGIPILASSDIPRIEEDVYAFVIPAEAADAESLNIKITAKARGDAGEYIINKRIVQGSPVPGVDFTVMAKGTSDADFATLMPDAGLLRARSGDTVKVPVAAITSAEWFASQSKVELTAYNLSAENNAKIATQDLISNTGDFTFTMPAGNVELVLNLTAKPVVTTRIERESAIDSNSGASLTLSPANPDAGQEVTVNVNLFGGGCEVDALSAYETDALTACPVTPDTYQRYKFAMPSDGSDVTVVLRLKKVATTPTMQSISTMPFFAEGKKIYGVSYWIRQDVQYQTALQSGALLDEAGKTMKAPVGGTVMFYASKNPEAEANDWDLNEDGVRVVVGDGEAAVEHVYGKDDFIDKSGDAYSFTMPDAPVTIAVDAKKTNTPIQILTETYVDDGTRQYPYSDLSSGAAGNLRTYAMENSALVPKDEFHIGDQVFVAAHPMYGGKLKSITMEQEGCAPLDIMTSNPYNQQLGADVYSFTAARGSVFRVKAVYDPNDFAYVSIEGLADDKNLELIGERIRTLLFGRIYDPNGSDARRGAASTIIELKTAEEAAGNLIYTLKMGTLEHCEADLKLLEYRRGYAKYELSVSAAPSEQKPIVQIHVEKADFGKRPVIESMTVNHTSADKFQYILIKGKNLRNLVQESPYSYDYNLGIVLQQSADKFGESWLPNTYSAGADRSTLVASGDGTEAKLYVKNLNFKPESPAGAAAQPPFAANNNYCLQLDWRWGGELGIGPNIEGDAAWTTWGLTDLSFDYSPNDEYPYAFVLKSQNGAFYSAAPGKEPGVPPDKNSEYNQIVAVFECKDGFALTKNIDGSTAIALKNPQSSVLVNGMLTLKPSGAAGTPFALTQKDETVTLKTNMKLVAKGTTLFSPAGSMGSLKMEFKSGAKYANSEEDELNSTYLPTFTPTGDISVDIFGYNGFRAEYDAIKLSSATNSVRLTGGLSLQVPGVNMPLAGLELEKLQLNLANASPGFDGIKASGDVNASIAIIALNGAAEVDTFNNYYRFEGEVEVPVFEARGYLELTESERFKIPMLEAFHIQVAADKGIPLVPPVVVGYLNGLEGGIFGLASTLDYDPTNPAKPILPPLRIAAGARFQLLELLEFWVELTAGPAYFKQSMHDMYINLKGINFQLVEELTMEVGVYTETGASGRSRVGFGYNARLRINLLKGIVSDIFLAQGDLNISASMDHPSYWIDKQETYTSALTLLNAINAQFAASGKVAGILQVPSFSIFGNDYGPFRIASAGAWFDAGIPLSEQIRATYFRAGMDLAWGIFGIKMDYDFMSPWQAPNFDISLFSEGGEEAGALYAETFGDANSGGRITIGEGIRVVADSFGETGAPAQDAGIRTFAVDTLADAITVHGDANSFTHSVTVPQDGKDHWIQAASLVKGADMNLTVYDPEGNPIALRPAPYNATGTAEQGPGYNALRAKDGSALIFRADKEGEYRLTSNGEFRSRLMEADPRPEITESELKSNAAELSFTAENLDISKSYRYRVVLEKKKAYGDETEETVVLDDDAITGVSTFSRTLTIADFGLNDRLETGNYFPTVLLYGVSGQDDPDTPNTDEERRELLSASNVYDPIAVTNALAKGIAGTDALKDLAVAAAGNESINLTFTGATVADGFGGVADDGDTETNEDKNPALWKPSHYTVKLYDETGKPATKAVDALRYEYNPDGSVKSAAPSGEQTEAPLSFTVSEDLGKDNGFDVLLAGIPGGHTYTVEVTPVFVCEYEMPAAMQMLINRDEKVDAGEYGKNTAAIEQKGLPVTRTVAVPEANPPQIAIKAFKSAKESVNGTAAYFLSEGAYLDIAADQASDITVRKYSSGAAGVIASKTGVTAGEPLRLTDADFADKTNGSGENASIELMSSGLFAITAKNAAGDTATELVNIAVDKSAPFLLIDGLTSSSRNAVNGSFTITGSTEPGARVVSGTGHSAVGGADGRFTLQGVISGSVEDVFITATDAAGNATTECVTMTYVAGPSSPPGGGDGGAIPVPDDKKPKENETPPANLADAFTDVNKSDWYYGDVEFVLANGLFVGTSATSFGPRLPMTRGMLVTVLGRLAGVDASEYARSGFDDVTEDKYYAAFVSWAKENGIVSGVGGNLFAPDGDVSRQDMAVILYRYARFMGMELPKKEERQPFADEAGIAGYALDAMYAMREAGVVTGKPGNLADPRGKATRAEVAAMFHRFVEATK